MTITMYGIPNCDTIKKAKKWLEAEGIDYQFHDYRKQGVDPAMVTTFCDALGWENVLNKRSTSWRNLTDEQKTDLDQAKAVALMIEQPTLVRRPVLDRDSTFKVGFKDADYQAFFAE